MPCLTVIFDEVTLTLPVAFTDGFTVARLVFLLTLAVLTLLIVTLFGAGLAARTCTEAAGATVAAVPGAVPAKTRPADIVSAKMGAKMRRFIVPPVSVKVT